MLKCLLLPHVALLSKHLDGCVGYPSLALVRVVLHCLRSRSGSSVILLLSSLVQAASALCGILFLNLCLDVLLS